MTTITNGAGIAQAARRCVGSPFRPQGRDPALGLDCVGVIAVACHGWLRGEVPSSYPQRGGGDAWIVAAIGTAGLRAIQPGAAGEGDVLLLSTGPAQWHLAVLTADGFIHADAGLRRVTEVPGPPPWRIVGAWRCDVRPNGD